MGWKTGTIIGVVRDFHFNSLHKKIEPVVIFIEPSGFEYISVRIKPGNISQIIGFLKQKWIEFIPGQTFVYSFLDDDFDRLYKTEFRLQRIFMIISVLAVFIACLGLLGLTTFAVEQRTKEIGIRKVLGASAVRIVLLLSKEFTRLIVAANIFAWPIAWYAMNQWLKNFAYRTDVGIWIFLSAGIIVLVIALLTLSLKVVKAASSKPVDTLRYE
jgi:putative ABC transport system permease protein